MEYDNVEYSKISEKISKTPWNREHWIIFIAISTSFFMWGITLAIAPLITTWYFVPQFSYYYIIGAAPAGLLLGNMTMGYISDRLGRKNIFLLTIGITVLGLLGIGISYNYIYLIIFVFIAEFGLGGDETLSLAIMVEYLPLKNRGFAIIESSNMANIGITLIAGLFLVFTSSVIIQKMWLITIAILSGIISIIARYHMEESGLWILGTKIGTNNKITAGNAIKFLALSFMGIAIIVGFAFSDLVLGPFHFPQYTGVIIFFSVLAESVFGVLGGYYMGKSSRKTLAMVGFTGMLASWVIAVIFLNIIISNLFYLLAILSISSIFGEIAWGSRELLEPENFISKYRGRGIGSVRSVGYALYIVIIFILINAGIETYAFFILIVYLAGFAGSSLYMLYGRETKFLRIR
ncbi:MAG TPA: MFS transporter [Ferroplasma sp.]|nr:MFS transporter [Ferroplasma sp.]